MTATNTVQKKNPQNREKRVSREQETWDNVDLHDLDVNIDDGNVGPLPYIKAQPGMAQRWMRTITNGEYDAKNVAKMKNKHWRKRSVDSIPANIAAPIDHIDALGETIGASGMVLVERPLAIHEKYAARVREANQAQRDAVDQSLFQTKAAGDNGFGVPHAVEDKTVAKKIAMPVDD